MKWNMKITKSKDRHRMDFVLFYPKAADAGSIYPCPVWSADWAWPCCGGKQSSLLCPKIFRTPVQGLGFLRLFRSKMERNPFFCIRCNFSKAPAPTIWRNFLVPEQNSMSYFFFKKWIYKFCEHTANFSPAILTDVEAAAMRRDLRMASISAAETSGSFSRLSEAELPLRNLNCFWINWSDRFFCLPSPLASR